MVHGQSTLADFSQKILSEPLNFRSQFFRAVDREEPDARGGRGCRLGREDDYLSAIFFVFPGAEILLEVLRA